MNTGYRRPTQYDVRGARGPDASRDPHAACGGEATVTELAQAVPNQRPGGVQAPRRARARRPDHPRALSTTAPVAIAREPLKTRRLARLLPSVLEQDQSARRGSFKSRRMHDAMAEPSASGASEYGIRINARVRRAPRTRVEGMDRAGELRRLYGGPECEVPLSSVSMDVRHGRQMAADDVRTPTAVAFDWRGEYRESTRPERLCLHSHRPARRRCLRARDRLAHRPRRRPHRDAVRTARLDGPGAIRARNDGWGTFFDRMPTTSRAGLKTRSGVAPPDQEPKRGSGSCLRVQPRRVSRQLLIERYDPTRS